MRRTMHYPALFAYGFHRERRPTKEINTVYATSTCASKTKSSCTNQRKTGVLMHISPRNEKLFFSVTSTVSRMTVLKRIFLSLEPKKLLFAYKTFLPKLQFFVILIRKVISKLKQMLEALLLVEFLAK